MTPTPASPPELCPDCQRPLGELPPFYKLGACVGRKGSSYLPDCREHAITRLRSALATTQAGLDALVAERELERAAVNAALAWEDTNDRRSAESAELVLAAAVDELRAHRAKAGR